MANTHLADDCLFCKIIKYVNIYNNKILRETNWNPLEAKSHLARLPKLTKGIHTWTRRKLTIYFLSYAFLDINPLSEGHAVSNTLFEFI